MLYVALEDERTNYVSLGLVATCGYELMCDLLVVAVANAKLVQQGAQVCFIIYILNVNRKLISCCTALVIGASMATPH